MQNRAYRNMLSIAVILLAAFFTTSSLLPIHEDLIEVTPAQLTPAKRAAIQWVDSNRDLLASLNDRVWSFAELALQEFKSSALLAKELERNGFKVTRGVSDMPTAFVAESGSGRPIIGILAEYDALPTLSQKAVSTKETVRAGEPGHGCGHSVFGTGSVGAALALKHVMQVQGIPGTIRLYGTPAEENYSGKTYMARDGWFDDLDVALHWHPGSLTKVGLGSSNAMNGVQIEFYGKTAHAAGSPWSGQSALDAVELLNISMNYLREHMKITARVHYVTTHGGGAANVVPEYARVLVHGARQGASGSGLLARTIAGMRKGCCHDDQDHVQGHHSGRSVEYADQRIRLQGHVQKPAPGGTAAIWRSRAEFCQSHPEGTGPGGEGHVFADRALAETGNVHGQRLDGCIRCQLDHPYHRFGCSSGASGNARPPLVHGGVWRDVDRSQESGCGRQDSGCYRSGSAAETGFARRGASGVEREHPGHSV